ncbi:zinc finger, CCHC-type containing protein, partial [Tanacetum coccineum]
MNMDEAIQLGNHLRIEESLRVQDSEKPKGNNVAGPSIVNMVEHNNSFMYNDNKGKRKHHDTKVDLNKKSKVTYWKCGKPRNLKNNCKGEKVGNKDNDVAWWVDSGETVHVCKDKYWIKTYESLNDGSSLHIGNESTTMVHGRGCVNLRFSSGKIVCLILGYVHFKRLQDMSKDGLIPAFDMDTEKYKTCMLTKITKKSFQNVKRKTKVLELIHSDLCDLHTTPSLGNKKYFVTFIDDASRTKSRVLGAVVRLHDPKLKTLGERGIECVFVGYAEHSKAFRFFVIDPNESVLINSIIEFRDVVFDENRFSSVLRPRTRDEVFDQHSYCFNVEDDPKTFDEAMKSQDVTFWKEANNDKMDSIMGNNTWVLADLPLGCKPLGANGSSKENCSTIRLLIAMALIHGLIIHQMDVKTTFLNGELEEDVYMNQPQGFIMPGNENKVCKLIKSLYGQKLTSKEFLSSRFSMKDIGEADVILGIRIKHESNGIAISQSHYIEKVLKKFNYFECTPVSTPMDTSEKLMPNNGQAVSQLKYSRVIGCLICPSVLEGYTNASWVSNTEDNLSTSDWVFLLDGGTTSWASKKQTCITGSIIESEFMALAAAGKESEWLKNFLLEIPLWSKPIAPTPIHCDSVATLAKAYSQMYNGKSRHLGVRHSMIRELIT